MEIEITTPGVEIETIDLGDDDAHLWEATVKYKGITATAMNRWEKLAIAAALAKWNTTAKNACHQVKLSA